MGAVTALLYSQRDPSVAGMVLDSPFSRLTALMLELASDQQLRVPKPLVRVALAMLRRSVRRRAGFDIDKVSPLDVVPHCHIPAFFGGWMTGAAGAAGAENCLGIRAGRQLGRNGFGGDVFCLRYLPLPLPQCTPARTRLWASTTASSWPRRMPATRTLCWWMGTTTAVGAV